MTELHAVATIPAKPGSEDVIRSALTTLVEATRAEDGCLAYDLFESASAPGTFVTIERWTDAVALGAHLATDHVAAAFAAADGHLAGEVAVHPLAPVS
jgi:quinol monooxygenase YgiN